MTKTQRGTQILSDYARRQRLAALAPAHRTLAAVLDDLDAWGALETARARGGTHVLAYGPKTVRGGTPAPWYGALVWYRRKGMDGHDVLGMVGVWACDDGAPVVRVGVKRVAFSAPYYNAESYHKLIRTDYTAYYTDDGAPPPGERCLYCEPYQATARLATRTAITAALNQWAQAPL